MLCCSHFSFCPLAKNAESFGKDLEANYFRKGPWNSIPPSKHLSQRVVMELGFMTILFVGFFMHKNYGNNLKFKRSYIVNNAKNNQCHLLMIIIRICMSLNTVVY